MGLQLRRTGVPASTSWSRLPQVSLAVILALEVQPERDQRAISRVEEAQPQLKILRARKAAAGRLTPKDEERLKFLEQTLGRGQGGQRLQIEERPPRATRTTARRLRHEVSEICCRGRRLRGQKTWDQASSRAEGQPGRDSGRARHFKQKGLWPFAIDLSSDLQGSGPRESNPRGGGRAAARAA